MNIKSLSLMLASIHCEILSDPDVSLSYDLAVDTIVMRERIKSLVEDSIKNLNSLNDQNIDLDASSYIYQSIIKPLLK